MEDPERRKERLKAMRMGTLQPEISDVQSTSMTGDHLFNPLAQSADLNSPAEGGSHSHPRFDYYTDPMAAFSGSKRRAINTCHNAINDSASPIRSTTPMFHSPSTIPGPRKTFMSPVPVPVPANQFQVNHSPLQGSYVMQFPIPQNAPWPRQNGGGSPYPERSPGSSSGSWIRPVTPSSYGFHHNASKSCFTGSDGPEGSPRFNSGRSYPSVHYSKGNQSSPSGRGYGPRFGSSPGPRQGWSSGAHKGSYEHASGREMPEKFFSKIMVADPWSNLEPIVGNILFPLSIIKTLEEGSNSWFPKSISMTKDRVEESGKRFSSKSSLAEFLAQSFEEAASESDGVTGH